MDSVMECARRLADALRQSDERRALDSLRETVNEDPVNAALLKEYRKLQTILQLAAATGQNAPDETTQRFSQMSALLYARQDIASFLMAEMRMQKQLADVFALVTEAAGVEIDLNL